MKIFGECKQFVDGGRQTPNTFCKVIVAVQVIFLAVTVAHARTAAANGEDVSSFVVDLVFRCVNLAIFWQSIRRCDCLKGFLITAFMGIIYGILRPSYYDKPKFLGAPTPRDRESAPASSP
tara:strand:+ start:2624 stop:2986 length:363 start_codon:yes stop_codon:yes gene_type:complete